MKSRFPRPLYSGLSILISASDIPGAIVEQGTENSSTMKDQLANAISGSQWVEIIAKPHYDTIRQLTLAWTRYKVSLVEEKGEKKTLQSCMELE